MQMLKYLVILAAAAALDSCSLNLLAPKYTVGGTVTGVVGTGLVLQVNSGDNLGIVTQGSFTFGSSITKGDTYTVTVATQPTDPVQTCSVYNGTGTISNVDVGNVIVTCVQTGQFAYVANETDATISAFVIDSSTGALGQISGSPFATGGTAPVAVVVDPNGLYLYAVENGSNEVAVFTIDAASGALTETALPIVTGNSPAAIAIHPNNQFAYVANSADDTLTAYTLSNGVATPISGADYIVGVDPVDVKIDPSGNYLYVANYSDGTVSAFTIDYTTGLLTAVTGSPFTAGGSGNETHFPRHRSDGHVPVCGEPQDRDDFRLFHRCRHRNSGSDVRPDPLDRVQRRIARRQSRGEFPVRGERDRRRRGRPLWDHRDHRRPQRWNTGRHGHLPGVGGGRPDGPIRLRRQLRLRQRFGVCGDRRRRSADAREGIALRLGHRIAGHRHRPRRLTAAGRGGGVHTRRGAGVIMRNPHPSRKRR